MDIDPPTATEVINTTIPIISQETDLNPNQDIQLDPSKMLVDKEDQINPAQTQPDKEENEDVNKNDNKTITNEKTSLIRLPGAKIKNTIKKDKDIKLCQKNAYYVIGKLTELFIQQGAKDSRLACRAAKRKTININDINTALKKDDNYGFIDIKSIGNVDIPDVNESHHQDDNQNKGENVKNKEGKKHIEKKEKTVAANNNMTIDKMFGFNTIKK